jgi:hypothetical protein
VVDKRQDCSMVPSSLGSSKEGNIVSDQPGRTIDNIDKSIKRILAPNGMVSGIMRKKVL